MRLIKLKDFYNELRIGYERIPELVVSDSKTIETDIIAAGVSFSAERAVTLELRLSLHASSYALLGARYMPVPGNNLHLEVRYLNNCSEHYESAHATNGRTVFKGLHKLYADSVLSTSIDYLKSIEIHSGEIIFDTAACCNVGSSPLIFIIATKIVLSILLNTQYPLPDSAVENIIEKYLAERYHV